ncbi:hypothetical protein AGDE_14192 [Angomonas deanei]|uniref:Uncharacterized protein n=1 Tax=Angomonas deanei TaxID=59799 RepID=A0A7G2CJB8_9TRYP|nr:hypothetical protein AGDE_14192 [Angomonas deanei]CAD2219499.1 hypothetical protein, conserved [Angomonas deanei]|eukprot:EPY21290.1 hypothetical protein AGDE_14192 [Angomonas deanei]
MDENHTVETNPIETPVAVEEPTITTTRTGEEPRQRKAVINEEANGVMEKTSPAEQGTYKSAFGKQRLSTPERIRQRAAKLYEEVHDLIDKHETRNDRQREIGRRDTGYYEKKESIANIGRHNSRSASRGSSRGSRSSSQARLSTRGEVQGTQALDLQRTFEDSRRQHLLAAQAERSQFPSMDYRMTDSTKDPGMFSQRFTDDTRRLT